MTPELQAAVERVQGALDYLDADNDDRADEGEQPVEEVEVNAADLRLILAALEERGKALEPFALKWRALRDPLPQGPFSLSVDAMDCCQAFRLTALGGTADV